MTKYKVKSTAPEIRIDREKDSIILHKATQPQLKELYNAGFREYIEVVETIKKQENDK